MDLLNALTRHYCLVLSTSVDDNPFQWEEFIDKVCFAYNTSVQSSTGFTPFFLMYERGARLPIDCVFELPQQSVQVTEYAYSLTKSLNQAYELAREKFGMKQQTQKESCNKRHHGTPYAVGVGYTALVCLVVRPKSLRSHGLVHT